jgi:hypothetical protein
MIGTPEAAKDSLDREAIRDLVARYNAYGDSGKFDLLLELFLPDAVMEIYGLDGRATRYEGADQIRSIFTRTQGVLQGDAAVPRYMRHFTSTHQIDFTEDGLGQGRLYFAVLMPHGLDHWGRYLDRYAVSDGRWRFAERTVRVDGRVANSLFER